MEEKCLKMLSEYRERRADVMCGGRLFLNVVPETGKARLPTAERLNGHTAQHYRQTVAVL